MGVVENFKAFQGEKYLAHNNCSINVSYMFSEPFWSIDNFYYFSGFIFYMFALIAHSELDLFFVVSYPYAYSFHLSFSSESWDYF